MDAVIVDVVRTAVGRGKAGGALSSVHPADLLAQTLRAIVERSALDTALIEDVIVGCVSQVGEQSTNLGRTAVLSAGFDERVPAMTIDRQCGSSQQAAQFAAQGVLAGFYDVVIAAGVESMSRVPLGSAAGGAHTGGRLLHERYPDGLVNQGVAAERIAVKWALSRSKLDAFAARSHALASTAQGDGRLGQEIIPITVPRAGDAVVHSIDETVRPGTTVEGLAALPPSFRTPDYERRFPEIPWAITAGNSSPLTDGASAALIMSDRRAASLGLIPRARFHSFSVVGDDPLYMLTGPIPATRKVLERSGMSLDDFDVIEINEAFASIPLAWAREFDIDPNRINVRGGAIALGHALGSSGTRLLTTMLHELESSGGRYGLQVMCEGGGTANATIIERL